MGCKNSTRQIAIVQKQITDIEAFKEYADNLWKKHNVKNGETLTLELAKNTDGSYIMTVK